MTSAKQLHLRLYLEGEEVPVVSAQVTIGINTPSTASIQIIPTDEGVDLKPRTMVHLFIYDDDPKVRSSYVENGTYRLLFAGEAIGFSLIKNNANRALILQCVDFTGYWMAAHITAIEYAGTDSNAMVDHSELFGGDPSLMDDLEGKTAQKIVEWVNQSPKTPGLDSIKGLAGGIIRIMEMVGGVINETGKRSTGFNDFFTVAELRARLLQQICAEENDKSAEQLITNLVANQWISNDLQNLGRQITLNDVILLLLKYIYYDYVPNPAAKYEPFAKYDTKSENKRSALSMSALGNRALANINVALTTLNKIFSEYDTTESQNRPVVELKVYSGPMARPSDADTVQYKESAPVMLSEISERVERSDTHIRNLRASLKGTLPYLDDARKALTEQKDKDPSIAPLVDDIIGKIDSAIVFSGKHASSDLTLGDLSSEIQILMNCVSEIESRESTTTVSTFTGGTVQRLKSVLFRPDCWFAAPPRCNVLFPEQYTSVNYDRNWVGEVTRAQTTSHATPVGNDPTNMLNYTRIAPQTDLIADADRIDDNRSYRFLMSHELHTGIVPRTMWVPDGINITDGEDATGVEDGGEKNDWLQHATTFHYFSARFSTRSVSISARLNPSLVCGFPGAVIMTPFILPPKMRGKHVDVDTLMKAESVPYQLVGMINAVTHNIDQNGGSTSVSMSHVRRHRGLDDELLSLKYDTGGNFDKVIWYTITKKDAQKDVDIKATGGGDLSGLESFGKKKSILWASTPQGDPSGVDITKVDYAAQQDVIPPALSGFGGATKVKVDAKSKSFVTESSEVAANRTKEKSKKKSKEISHTRIGSIDGVPDATGVQIPDGPIDLVYGTTDGLFYGKIVGVEVVNSKRTKLGDKYVFETIRVYEKINISIRHSPPLEEIVRPLWFSDGYSNENISNKIYLPFLGCRSVVDEIEVSMTGKGSKARYLGNNRSGIQVDANKGTQAALDKVQKVEEVRARNSVDRAITWWSYIYGEVKSVSSTARDVEKFIKDFTTRPIATIDQILGTADLKHKISGFTVSTLRGKEGFHSSAVARDIIDASKDYRLLGLLDNPDSPYPRLNEGGPESIIPRRYDVRYEKKKAVLKYKRVMEIEKGRGIRG